MTLERLTAQTLAPEAHAFFTRRGGVSEGLYAGLNCGTGSGDAADAVARNRALAAQALGCEPARLVTLHQIHSADALAVDGPLAERPKADALATAEPGLVLGILTADCMPVLLAEPEAGVVGAAHAGWRGALEGVIEAAIGAMEGLGAARGRIRAAIGPCISQAAYEVGPEFIEEFMDRDPGSDRFFANGAHDRHLFDLPGYGLRRLREAGVAEALWTRHCTYGDPDRFFSYRRATHEGAPDYGRLLSAIRL